MLLPVLAFALGVYAQSDRSCIEWQPCPDATNLECGSYQVPLDYAHPEVGNATLALARIKAFNEPRLGTLFTNPGGPGESGTQFVKDQFGATISNTTNGQYDIVSWDPRGVNQTKPQATCGFTSQDAYEQAVGMIVAKGIEARGNFTDQDDLDNFFAQLNTTDSSLVRFGEQCMREQGDVLKYMGTAAVIRDMISLSDCLEGPGKPVNYWGFSYGTVIGNYFVNMFPERVGRVIIDGVADIVTWATEPSYKLFASSFSTIQSTFAGFTQKCAEAGPQRCALAHEDSTPASIAQSIQRLIDTAYDRHKAGDTNPNHTAAAVRTILLTPQSDGSGGMYHPTGWGELASLLVEVNNTFTHVTSRTKISPLLHSRIPRQQQNLNASIDFLVEEISQKAIVCVDSIDQDNVTTKQVFDEVVRVTHEEAPLFGELLPIFIGFVCHRFPIRAVERFTGPFNHTLAYPIIVIGNEADPVTPFAGAKRVADALGSSARLLKQNGFGHTTLAESSNCTRGVVHDYLLHGKLPSNGKVCEVDQVVFPPNGALTA